MTARRKKGSSRKRPQKKRVGRKQAARKGGARRKVPVKQAIDAFAAIQKASLKRYQDYAEFALRGISQGNFKPRDWVNETTALWSGMLDDMTKAMKVYL
jgi:hypothetical protein